MRRDYFEVDMRNVDENEREPPVVTVNFDGPDGLLADRLVTADGTLDADEIDVTFRRTETDDVGVLSVSNRITGEFVLEANADVEAVRALVDAARSRADDEPRYRVRVTDADGKSTVYDKETLLVYDREGSLRRGESLIPGGVEL